MMLTIEYPALPLGYKIEVNVWDDPELEAVNKLMDDIHKKRGDTFVANSKISDYVGPG